LLRVEGPVSLEGELSLGGAKNAALPVLVAAAAGSAPVSLRNVPVGLEDVKVEIEALRRVGCRVEIEGSEVTVAPPGDWTPEIPAEISGLIRTSLLFLGLFAGRCGRGKVSMPGGCRIGERKHDLHLEGLRSLGATVIEGEEGIEIEAAALTGADIHFYLPSTTATETVMIAACFAKGRTRIFNAHTPPVVEDTARCLNAMGADITVRSRVVEIEGRGELGGAEHTVIPGFDEAVTYLVVAAMTGGEVRVGDLPPDLVRTEIALLGEVGVEAVARGGDVRVDARGKRLRPFDLLTAPHPGIGSDMQPIFAALASRCEGESTITDSRFTERFRYVEELEKMGMDIDHSGNVAVVRHSPSLRGARVFALDLRCGAALVISALAARGVTEIENEYQVFRGYEDLVGKLGALGASIERTES